MVAPPAPARVALLDALKALASQLIVWHHLAFYGPMSDTAWPLAPRLWAWLADDARMAVQVFLVVGGFLAARSLAPHGRLVGGGLLPTLGQRYVRLAGPYLVTLVLAVLGNALAARWMSHPSLSSPPSFPQGLAHVLLLQDLVGVEALTAGAWYVAIDLQLFALFLGLLWLARRAALATSRGARGDRAWSLGLVLVLAAASLFHVNLQPERDAWALYFFGAYALGAVAWWGSHRACSIGWGLGLAAGGAMALAWAWRDRLALALGVALLLWAARWARQRAGWRADLAGAAGRCLAWLGQISYALFLVHFPVCLVVNAAFARFMPAEPQVQLGGVVLAWMLSLAAAAAFHHAVERPIARLVAGRGGRGPRALAR